ncbi:copper oxidase [Nitrosomonas supralitoralis]|uniref:Copper oxidase n=2 Tax=Nitrosomonas supralitoralis TaxID=2116706 RepID=A0A2P7NRH6_9PROT|nr:copper oxidase [Nitrosomonas supralitoralis]
MIIFMLFAAMLLFSNLALAATHTISLSAEKLPNGQFGYKMINHASSEGDTPTYPDTAVIPGPTLFVKQGDVVNVELINNIDVDVGFFVPELASGNAKQVAPGQTGNYQINTQTVGTFPYGDIESHLVGLFGAIVVDNQDNRVQSFVDVAGEIVSIKRKKLDKEIVLFMVGSTFWGTEIINGTQTPLWTNPSLRAVQDDKIRFHILSLGPGHTWHLHAHRWLESTGIPVSQTAPSVIDVRLMKDNYDSHSFTVKAGVGVGPGVWQYHCHLFSHMEAGMAGTFTVLAKGSKKYEASIAGASPYGAIYLNPSDAPGLVTFEITDVPGSHFRSTRHKDLSPVTKTRSLEIIPPESSVHFVMSDTEGVHTITSLIWPSGANDDNGGGDSRRIPFDQIKPYRGGGIVKLSTPGLYVFTCKVHPYMFGAVIVDDPATVGLDLGDTIDIAGGLNNIPTSSDLATQLLKLFLVSTTYENWMNFASNEPWTVSYPSVDVRTDLGPLNLADVLIARYHKGVNKIPLAPLINPAIPGVGEVWIDTQSEKTAGKAKHGTVTVLDAETWKLKRKIALPEINMNNPHNMWTNRDQSVVYVTQWFDKRMTFVNREDGSLIRDIRVGDSPAHVMTLPTTDELLITLNGENGMARINPGEFEVNRRTFTQTPGADNANPHGHWIKYDGTLVSTSNIGTHDAGIYDTTTGQIMSRTPTGAGSHPIAAGMTKEKLYMANLLTHSVTVVRMSDGENLKTISLIADYDPISGKLDDNDKNGVLAIGVLPVQTPVSPDGRAVVTANLLGMITIIDTRTDEIVKMLPCPQGCHGVNFGAKKNGGYYAYVTSQFADVLTIVDIDPNGDGNLSDADVVGLISLVADNNVSSDDTIIGMQGQGGQGVLAIPNVYNGWVQNLPETWKAGLTAEQINP